MDNKIIIVKAYKLFICIFLLLSFLNLFIIIFWLFLLVLINFFFFWIIFRLYSLIKNHWWYTTILIIFKSKLFLLNDFLFLIFDIFCYFWQYLIFIINCINWYIFWLSFRNYFRWFLFIHWLLFLFHFYLRWFLFIHWLLFPFHFKMINECITYFFILKLNIRNFQILRRINVFLTWG